MKLNYNLIRDLLLLIEEEADGFHPLSVSHYVNQIHGYSDNIIRYHIKFLQDSRFIEYKNLGFIIDITPAGRKYLDNVRNPELWNRAQKIIQPFGKVGLDIVSAIGESLLLKEIGL